MKLSEFLHFNSHCPICGETLSLYMQWVDSVCFKGVKFGDDTYKFYPFVGAKKDGDIKEDDHMLLQDKGTDADCTFSSAKMLQESKRFDIYFFFLCNPSGFKVKSWGDYEISLYQGCYYRDTEFFEFEKNKQSKKWILTPKDKNADLLMKHEAYSFKDIKNENERVYMVNLDYEKKQTTLWHYATTTEEREKEDFKPNLFSKEMPLLKTRIKAGIDDRERLIDRLNSWILVS
jgi:hypothetical protein